MDQLTFTTYSFGCRVNHAEREEIDRHMIQKGFQQIPSDSSQSPHVIIINTCAITHNAERSARQMIYQMRRNNPKSKIVVTGCSATYWLKHNLHKDLDADFIVDNINKEFITDLIEKKFYERKKSNSNNLLRDKFVSLPTDKFLNSHRMVIKIQDGCHRFCTFCIVPYLRGQPHSEKIASIVTRIKNTEQPLKEVILTAINTEAFGKDTGETLIDLIKQLLVATNIPRISFGSIHPWSITDEFLHFYNTEEMQQRFVHFFHIPLQSGSNKVLATMHRVHTREDMGARIDKIVQINRRAFIATDIVTGFLGESDEDFNETYDFLKSSPISRFHVFRFSKRIQTAAYYMAKRLKEPTIQEKKDRSEALRTLSAHKYNEFRQSLIGEVMHALILPKTTQKKHQEALLSNQIPVTLMHKHESNVIVPLVVKDFDQDVLIAEKVL